MFFRAWWALGRSTPGRGMFADIAGEWLASLKNRYRGIGEKTLGDNL